MVNKEVEKQTKTALNHVPSDIVICRQTTKWMIKQFFLKKQDIMVVSHILISASSIPKILLKSVLIIAKIGLLLWPCRL